MAKPCDRCNGTAVLMKADFSWLVCCPECTYATTDEDGLPARTTKNGDNK